MNSAASTDAARRRRGSAVRHLPGAGDGRAQPVEALPYKFWRHLHRAMPVFYLLLAFHAAVLAPPDYWTQPVGVLLALLLAAGTVASVIALTGRIGHDRRCRAWSPRSISPAPDVTEIVCRLDGAWRGHQAGQFAFVGLERFEGSRLHHRQRRPRRPRPQLSDQALGDYTRQLASRVAVGQAVTIEGPTAASCSTARTKARQIWIAGGIGVTLPGLARRPARRPPRRSPDGLELHYSTRGAGSPSSNACAACAPDCRA